MRAVLAMLVVVEKRVAWVLQSAVCLSQTNARAVLPVLYEAETLRLRASIFDRLLSM